MLMHTCRSNPSSPTTYLMTKQFPSKSDVTPSKPLMTHGVNNRLNVHVAVLGVTTVDMISGTVNSLVCASCVKSMATLSYSVAGYTLYVIPVDAAESTLTTTIIIVQPALVTPV
jgi:ABC-type glycerol-3-phosphate transport system permease component